MERETGNVFAGGKKICIINTFYTNLSRSVAVNRTVNSFTKQRIVQSPKNGNSQGVGNTRNHQVSTKIDKKGVHAGGELLNRNTQG